MKWECARHRHGTETNGLELHTYGRTAERFPRRSALAPGISGILRAHRQLRELREARRAGERARQPDAGCPAGGGAGATPAEDFGCDARPAKAEAVGARLVRMAAADLAAALCNGNRNRGGFVRDCVSRRERVGVQD